MTRANIDVTKSNGDNLITTGLFKHLLVIAVLDYQYYPEYYTNKTEVSIYNCLVSLVVLSATAPLEVLVSIPTSRKKLLLGFSMKFSVAARS